MKEALTNSKSKVKFQNILNMDRCATNDKTLSTTWIFTLFLDKQVVAKANIGT